MAAQTKTRAKFGYLNYDSMIKKIADGKLDAYDINFAPDTKECYVITPELTPWAIKSRVYTFDDENSAIEFLNTNSDTYAGQIVSILSDNKYKAYVVNEDTQGFSVTPLSSYGDEIDYDTLGNRPIVNLVGTLDNPISIDSLESGIYMIKGQYVIAGIDTVFLSASNVLFVVDKSESYLNFKKITSHEITDYSIIDGETKLNTIVTSDYLDECGYATTEYVDAKILALDFITKEEISEYVENVINETLNDTIDEKIESKLAEAEADTSDIDSMF